MRKLIGKRANKSEFSHRWVEDIIYFDGPLLSILKGSTTQDYFYYWCDSDNRFNRWMCIPVTRKEIINYKSEKISLLDLCKKRAQLLFVDINSDLKPQKGKKVDFENIPEEYLPPAESFFDQELSPYDQFLLEPELYDLKLDGDWYLEELVGIPKIYSQLYAFAYTLKNLTRDSVTSNASRIFSNYPWKGGFSTVYFFKDLSAVIPSFHEPKVNSIQYASPGQIRLELLKPVSSFLESVTESSFKNRDELKEHSKNISQFLRAKELSKVAGNNANQILTRSEKDYLKDGIETFSDLMGLDKFKDDIISLSGNELVAIKIIMSVYRRTKKMFDFMERGMLSF